MNVPRQPFVGLSILAALGIVVGDFVPIPVKAWLFCVFGFVLAGSILIWKPSVILTYAFVAVGFFLAHNFRTNETPGLKLAERLGDRARTVRVVGIVATEPRIASHGLATFLLDVESIEFEGKTEQTHVALLVHWRGNPEFGDELKLFGVAE
ncbi:MAG TPA: DUF4131 domain-containing protein, partial [Chthoniobacterales bacterium]|nr:DUF4131 domain-containing protein [Chthoniobacterales bacterium]